MKCALVLIAVTMLSSCAAKKPISQKPRMVVTKECVVGFVEGSKCEAINADLVKCHDVLLKIACVKVSK